MLTVAELEDALRGRWIAAPGATLRDEDRKKARELVGVLREVELAVARVAAKKELTIVDAAAGRGYVGALTAERVLPAMGRRGRVIAIERRGALLDAARDLVEVREGDVGDPALWPDAPDVVVALHACGDASDRVIERATSASARWILVAPCCVAASLPSAQRATAHAEALGVPRHGEVRRAFVEAIVLAERTAALEAAGYRTEVVAFAPHSVTPYRLILRAERAFERVRRDAHVEKLARLRAR